MALGDCKLTLNAKAGVCGLSISRYGKFHSTFNNSERNCNFTSDTSLLHRNNSYWLQFVPSLNSCECYPSSGELSSTGNKWNFDYYSNVYLFVGCPGKRETPVTVLTHPTHLRILQFLTSEPDG